MKVALTGWNGFLATMLKERKEIEWVEYPAASDILLHLGGPTFTDEELDQHTAQVMHQYVRETIKIFDRFQGHIIFASTTGVNHIQLDHKGSTSYNLAKMYLENYLINQADSCAVLRIGTIISDDPNVVAKMRPDRIQPKILRNVIPKEWVDEYLYVETFVDKTIEVILQQQTGIIEYPLSVMNLAQLKKITR